VTERSGSNGHSIEVMSLFGEGARLTGRIAWDCQRLLQIMKVCSSLTGWIWVGGSWGPCERKFIRTS